MTPREQEPDHGTSFRDLGLLAFLYSAGVFVQYWPVLWLPHALDSLDHLHQLAEMRSGDLPFWDWLVLPHNVHTVPLVRLLFLVSTAMAGLDAWPIRLLVVAVPAVGAITCALIGHRTTSDAAAASLGGAFYALAAGFSGSVVWEPTNASFSMAAVLQSVAWCVLLAPGPITWARTGGVLALLALGLAALPYAAVAALAIPIWLAAGPARPRLRVLAALFTLALCVAGGLVARWNALRHGGDLSVDLSAAGIGKAGWLLLVTPYRLVVAATGVAPPGLAVVAVVSLVAWLLLLFSVVRLPLPLRRLVVTLMVGGGLFAVLIGTGRSELTLADLLLTDRYFSFFLLPFCLAGGATVVGAWRSVRARQPRTPAWLGPSLAIVLLGVELVAGRTALARTVPWSTYQAHATAVGQGRALVERVARVAAQNGTLVLADGPIPFDGVHKGVIALSCLCYSEHPRGVPGLRFSPRLDVAQERIANQLLDEWARQVGGVSSVCVVDGSLRDVRSTSFADFSTAACDGAVLDGFNPWEGGFRWMQSRGTVRLWMASDRLVVRARAPLDLLRRRWPDLGMVTLRVSLDDEPVGDVRVGSVSTETEIVVPASLARSRIRTEVAVTLAADVSWFGAELDPVILDGRLKSVMLLGVGFRGGEQVRRKCSAR